MTEKTMFTMEACVPGECAMPPHGRVFVVRPESLSGKYKAPEYQLHYCRATASLNNLGSFHAIFLADGERVRWNRSDVLGILKPELLPDDARLHLSQISRTALSIPGSTHRNTAATAFCRTEGIPPASCCAMNRRLWTISRCRRTTSTG